MRTSVSRCTPSSTDKSASTWPKSHVHNGDHPVTDTCSSACGEIDGDTVSGVPVRVSMVLDPHTTVCVDCLEAKFTGDVRECTRARGAS